MSGAVIAFPAPKPVVFVESIDSHGGVWGIFLHRPGHRPTQIAERLTFAGAESAARRVAEQYGAIYHSDMAPEPKGAA